MKDRRTKTGGQETKLNGNTIIISLIAVKWMDVLNQKFPPKKAQLKNNSQVQSLLLLTYNGHSFKQVKTSPLCPDFSNVCWASVVEEVVNERCEASSNGAKTDFNNVAVVLFSPWIIANRILCNEPKLHCAGPQIGQIALDCQWMCLHLPSEYSD